MLAMAEREDIRALDVSVFSESDVVNLIAQRSEILFDADGDHVMRQWSAGNEGPARDAVQARGDTLIRRAAGTIRAEYEDLRPTLAALAPGSLADIGCGYAIYDLFHWRDFPGRLVLIDLESTESRHFGYRESGAAYTSLETARRFLTANGVPSGDITLVNPARKALPKRKVDLAVSFLSCGFHYPVETYLDFFRDGVTARGAVILDVRGRRLRGAAAALSTLGEVSEVTAAANGKAARILMRRCRVA
jgi:hypothetical protein